MSVTELNTKPGDVVTAQLRCDYIADPLAAYRHLCREQPNSLLLESAEIESKAGINSIILVDPALKLTCRGNTVTVEACSGNGQVLLPWLGGELANWVTAQTPAHITVSFPPADSELDEDAKLLTPSVFDALRVLQHRLQALGQHQLAVFIAGVFAYDLFAVFEALPEVATGANHCPDFVFYLAETLLHIDHQAHTSELLGSVFSGPNFDHRQQASQRRLQQLQQRLAQMPAAMTTTAHKGDAGRDSSQLQVDKTDPQYCADVARLQENILAGDIFQVVPSRTFSLPCPDPQQAYAHLKLSNPSPFMFYMGDSDFVIFGASPESAVAYNARDNQIELYPIAGTRPRGKRPDKSIDPDLDSRIELTLREDHKEKAEHLMLVDLARNDVAKVSVPGTRHTKDLLKVDRYSHVMHLVSRVVGQLHPQLDALHAYQACMNMGTLVGAPKVRAAQLIRDIEQQRRGSYGGAIGYLTGKGDMHTCIVIRSAFVSEDIAHVQAGAGVVYDSVPQREADETRGKAQAVITAILQAHQQTRA